MQTLSEIRALLAERGLRPRRALGQHFLHDKNQIEKLVANARIEPGEVVLEVGPGTGTLTEALLEGGGDVVACEIDRGLASIIADRFGPRVRLIEGDCLGRGRSLSPAVCAALSGKAFKLVSNLPYQVAGSLICAVLIDHPECSEAFVTVQKEVADRLLAEPGTKAYGALSVTVRALSQVRRLAVLEPTCFWPVPKVRSTMCAIRRRLDHGIEDPAALSEFVTGLFTKRRKQLGGTFGRQRVNWPPGVTAQMRPDALSVEQAVALWRVVRLS